jgi:hypothetical protein
MSIFLGATIVASIIDIVEFLDGPMESSKEHSPYLGVLIAQGINDLLLSLLAKPYRCYK